jgi:3-oxoacyl-ACP reductase-like protein
VVLQQLHCFTCTLREVKVQSVHTQHRCASHSAQALVACGTTTTANAAAITVATATVQIKSISPASNGAVQLAVASKLKKSDKLIDMAEALMTIDGVVGVDLS